MTNQRRIIAFKDFLKPRKERFKPDDKAILNLKRINKIDFDGNIHLSDKASKTQMIIIKSGDLVISGINVSKGAISVYEDKEDVKATIHYSSYEFDKSIINIEYLKFFFKSQTFINLIKAQVKGGIKTEIKPKHLLQLKINLPSIEEQIKLAKKIDSKLNITESIQNVASTQQNLIQQLRQAILQEAIQGKLVPQDPNDEPASVLLERIKAEKAALIKAKKIKKEKPLPPITEEEIPFDLPEGWVWCRLGEIASIVRGGSPRPAKDPRFYDGNIPFLKVADLTATNKMYLDTHTYTIKEAGLHKTRYVEKDTLMLTNSGATLGIPKICTFPTTFNDGIAAFLGLSEISKPYLYFFLRFRSKWFLKEASRGQGQPNLNTDIIGKTLLPFPPLSEQNRIVQKVEDLLSMCDELQEQVEQSAEDAGILMQAVLQEAFES